MTDQQKFQEIWNEANENGKRKVEETFVQHVVAQDRLTGRKYPPFPICGFAWVKIKPATTKFARWLKSNGLARTSSMGGMDIWISDYNQSYDKKLAHAKGMAEVFDKHGIKCYADGRLD